MREPYQIIEIDQEICSLSHSVAPCTATGEPCYNTYATCQDIANYTTSALTLKFTHSKDNVPLGVIPSVLSVSTTPTTLNPGGASKNKRALGTRSTIQVVFQDHPYGDYFVDPYRDQRSYIASERGTFWTKWIARNPYYKGTPIRIIDGDLISGASNTRHYIIDNIDGPDSRGMVTLTGKDILSIADDDKALAPPPSNGELIADITTVDTTLRITGAAATEYPAPGYVRIGSNVIAYTGVSTIDANEINLTGCTQGQRGTEASDAEAGDRVQWCLEYDNQTVYETVYDLLTTYGNVNPSFITLADWQAENNTWLVPFNVSRLITESIGVTKLISEISESMLVNIWYDERQQKIRFKAVRPEVSASASLNEDKNIIADSVNIKRAEDERFSQVWLFHGQRDPTKKDDDESNWYKLRIAVDGENPYNEDRIKKIYSPWVQTSAQAQSVANRLLSRYKNTPIYIEMMLDYKDGAIWTGDITDISSDGLVDATGAPVTARYQILSSEEVESGHKIAYKAINAVYFGTLAVWMASDAPSYDTATDDEKKLGCFWADASGLINGQPGYEWQ